MIKVAALLTFAVLLGACGGAGAGGAAPSPTRAAGATQVPAVAGTEAPKDYQTPKPSGSPDDYYGY